MLPDFIASNAINAEILTFHEEVASSKQAQLLETTLPVVKTLVLAHDQGFVLAVLEGRQKVHMPAIEKTLNVAHVRLATPEEVEQVSGYPVGGVPPISVYGVPTLIDEQVLTYAWVIAGGGDRFSLLKIQSKDILAHAFEPRVVKLTP